VSKYFLGQLYMQWQMYWSGWKALLEKGNPWWWSTACWEMV